MPASTLKRAPLLFISTLVVLALSTPSPAITLDRIAATVGKQVILESEILRDLRIAAFLDQKPPQPTTDAKRKAAEHLVDLQLILREAAENRVILPGDEEAARLLDQVKMQYGDGYQIALKRYEVTEPEVRAHLLAGYRMLRFTDLRFRPEVQTTEDELREFYQLLAAGWRRGQNAEIPTFEESRETVTKLLIDQKVIQALDKWLASTRLQAGVIYRDRVFECDVARALEPVSPGPAAHESG